MIRTGTTVMRFLYTILQVAFVACLLGFAANKAYAIPLSDLLDEDEPQTITAGSLLFSDWTLIANGFETDLSQIDVRPLATPGNNTGLQFVDTGGVLVADFPEIEKIPEPEEPELSLEKGLLQDEDIFSNIFDFLFQYTVTLLDPRETIVEASLELTDFVVDGAGILTIDETLEDTDLFPVGLDGLSVLVQTVEEPNQEFLFDTDPLDSQRSLLVTTNVFGLVEVPEVPGDSGDLVRINSFEQRFLQVPEPATFGLLAVGLVTLTFLGWFGRKARVGGAGSSA